MLSAYESRCQEKNPHTKEVCHDSLVLSEGIECEHSFKPDMTQRAYCQWLFRSNSYHRLGLSKRIETRRVTLRLSPFDLLLDVMEQRNHISKTIFNVNVSVCDRDKQDLQLLGRSRERQQKGEDIIDALRLSVMRRQSIFGDSHRIGVDDDLPCHLRDVEWCLIYQEDQERSRTE